MTLVPRNGFLNTKEAELRKLKLTEVSFDRLVRLSETVIETAFKEKSGGFSTVTWTCLSDTVDPRGPKGK